LNFGSTVGWHFFWDFCFLYFDFFFELVDDDDDEEPLVDGTGIEVLDGEGWIGEWTEDLIGERCVDIGILDL
jgi:hypothetical protein